MRMSVIPRLVGWRPLGGLAALTICLAGGEPPARPAAVTLRSAFPCSVPRSGPAGSPLEAWVLDPQLGDPAPALVAVAHSIAVSPPCAGRNQVQLAAAPAA